jgi:CheY-like chemotaxis protein
MQQDALNVDYAQDSEQEVRIPIHQGHPLLSAMETISSAAMNALLTQPEPATSPTAWGNIPTPQQTAPARRLTQAEPRARILYVDDEPQLRRLGELVLARAGYEVDTAADGMEAWAALHDREYHLLITDHDMPKEKGLELAMQVRFAGMRLPIMLASGSVEAMHDPATAWLGLAAFLLKPFTPDSLLKTVEGVLLAANDPRQVSRNSDSVQVFFTRVEPYQHGGINE